MWVYYMCIYIWKEHPLRRGITPSIHVVCLQSMWKPAYDFLYSWSLHYGDSYRDMIQDLHLLLDKMKHPATRQWRQLTGALITVNCLDVFRASAYPKSQPFSKTL